MVISFAGRRVDAPNAPSTRFPLACVDVLAQRLRELFLEARATELVSSAACGADLVAIQVARELGMPFAIVVPFDVDTFAGTSVTDRPGDWLSSYQDACADASARGALIVLEAANSDEAAYELANERIVSEAVSRAANGAAMAVIAHEGASRGANDMTEAFARLARAAGIQVRHVSTLC
jgi:hypothetical protein